VSLVAVFLALAIGIIMGSTVIDRALVDTLEDQQQSLRTDLDDLSEENATLRDDLGDLREAGDRVASEGGERLLSGTLADVPVLVVAARGIDGAVLDDLHGAARHLGRSRAGHAVAHRPPGARRRGGGGRPHGGARPGRGCDRRRAAGCGGRGAGGGPSGVR
jgi:hypothetical protein